MPNRYEEAAKKAAKLTNKKYASEISSLTHLKSQEIEKLFPTRADKDKLLELLSIVDAATSDNQKIAKLRTSFNSLAGTILKTVRLLG